MQSTTTPIRLTEYSSGAGCGCKIAPAVLASILQTEQVGVLDNQLLVGNHTNDDAAVYDIGNGMATISTTDFFTPIVDDPFYFGKIAAANAISDVYAMGGKPILSIAILGWPIEKLSPSIAQQVLEGARVTCTEAGIALAGGHSVDTTEPLFGLAVTGMVNIQHLKRNHTAQEGDLIFLTKPIGVGILSTAQKRGVISSTATDTMIQQMSQLNSIGQSLGLIQGVTAMTDVTGFGLLGHLIEMTEGAGLSAEINYSTIPVIESCKEYLAQRMVPDATYRNWNSYSEKVQFEKGVNVMEAFNLLPDPQTNGGLLFTVSPPAAEEVIELLQQHGYGAFVQPIGKMIAQQPKTIEVKI